MNRVSLPGLSFLAAVALMEVFSAPASAQCTPNGLVVVVNKANPAESLSMAQLRRLLLGDLRQWPDKKAVSLVTPDPQSAAFKCVLSAVVRMTEAEYKRYIANAEFRGEEPVALQLAATPAAAAAMVNKAAGSIAIVDAAGAASVANSVRVLRINGKQPGEPGYPL